MVCFVKECFNQLDRCMADQNKITNDDDDATFYMHLVLSSSHQAAR